MIRASMQPMRPSMEAGMDSFNWTGYIVSGRAGMVGGVSGCWTVPTVSPSPEDAYSAAWVGVDGAPEADDYLLQIGTEQDWDAEQGAAAYDAWWEVITPSSQNPPTEIAKVSPGDAICASIARGTGGSWTISMTDQTSGGQFSTAQPFGGPAESAEWIVERPVLESATEFYLADLAGFSQVAFQTAKLNGANPQLTIGESGQMLDLTTMSVLAYSSAPSASGDGFTVTCGLPPGGGLSSPAPAAAAYTPLSPYRVCDTRAGSGTPCSGSQIGPGQSLAVQITGTGPADGAVPPNATAAVLNVTAIQGTAGTYLTLYPYGTAPPTASNLNVPAGVNQANLAVVALSTSGQVAVYNAAGSIDVAIDVEGYFAPPAGASGLFHPIPPLRICDTRGGTRTVCSGTPLGSGQWTKVVVSGCPTGIAGCSTSVPADGTAEAVAVNLTAVQGTQGTFLSIAPTAKDGTCPSTAPTFSNLNVSRGEILPNRVMTPLGPDSSGGPDQDLCVYNSVGTINAVLDINGWFGNGGESTPGAFFYSIPPVRNCDTRPSAAAGYTTVCSGPILGPAATLTIPVAGLAGEGVPAGEPGAWVVAVVANVTAVGGSASGYFTLYPAGDFMPTASDLNMGPGQVVANLAVVQLDTTPTDASFGCFDLYNDQGSIDAVVDVSGWFQQ